MAMIPEPLASKIRKFGELIPDEDLYDDGSGEHGRESDVHVTVKYGLHTDKAKDVRDVIGDMPSVTLKLDKMSVFNNDDYIVLKLDIESENLHELNKLISDNLECTDTFPDYHPHATIAYLKHREDDPDWYKKLFCDMFEGETAEIDSLLFSTADDKDYTIKLKGRDIAARVAMTALVADKFLQRG